MAEMPSRYALIYLAALVINLAVTFAKPAQFGVDSHFYARLADEIIREAAIGNIITTSYNKYAWFGYPLLAAGFKYAFGGSWAAALVVFQTMVYSLSSPFIAWAARQNARDMDMRIIAALSVVFPALHADFLSLNRFILKDTLYAGLAIVITVLTLAMAQQKNPRLALAPVALMIIAMTLRPTTLALAFAFCMIAAHMLASRKWDGKRAAKSLLAVTGISSVVFVLIYGYVLHNPSGAFFDGAAPYISTISAVKHYYFSSGAIIYDQKDTYIAPPQTYTGYLWMLTLKYVSYFKYWNSQYSLPHNLLRHMYFLPVYFLSGVYMINSAVRWKNIDSFRLVIVLYSVILIHACALLQSMTVIAYEFRYQFAIFGMLWIMAILGAKEVWAFPGRGRPEAEGRRDKMSSASRTGE